LKKNHWRPSGAVGRCAGHIAIEHGHRNSELSHEKMGGSFHSDVKVYQRVIIGNTEIIMESTISSGYYVESTDKIRDIKETK